MEGVRHLVNAEMSKPADSCRMRHRWPYLHDGALVSQGTRPESNQCLQLTIRRPGGAEVVAGAEGQLGWVGAVGVHDEDAAARRRSEPAEEAEEATAAPEAGAETEPTGTPARDEVPAEMSMATAGEESEEAPTGERN
jgi:hypothetical protein